MHFTETGLKGSYEIQLNFHQDSRGSFGRTFCKNEFSRIGHYKEWVQLNHSVTIKKGAIRGMHFQKPPYSEIKMVRCIAGSIYDVIIDIRKDSPTFLQYFGTELSASNRKMLYIPEGFAHGFQTLTDDCELIYHHSEFYTPAAEGVIRYDDPLVSIVWPLQVTETGERDSTAPLLTNSFKGI
jgi:dTDP-4-dehydrorhamnose 3,5-epimerase